MRYRHGYFESMNVGKGMLAGLIAGAAGTYVMTKMQPHIKQWTEEMVGGCGSGGSGESELSGGGESSAPATEQVATAVAEPVVQRELSRAEREFGSNAVHYGFGTVMGGVYGVMAEVAPPITGLVGLPAGALLFAVADEAAVPAAGLSDPPSETPMKTHLHGLVSHLVYGATVEICRKILRPLI
ncbi:MAG: DUF1440 domain-containing protein [Planctomycetales bacterium]|nr:DUF1440 domain-containing protein [Planctomycetales bacterium]